jgi:hypothetical protein
MAEATNLELREILRRHQRWLVKDLLDPNRDRDDNYLRMAGNLRVLLTDRKLPILLRYAERTGIVLYVWGPAPSPIPPDEFTVVEFSSHKVVWWPESHHGPFLKPFTIHVYLDVPIGTTSTHGPHARNSYRYTPRDLIGWTANKDGIAHLDPNKPEGLKALRKRSAIRNGERFDNQEVRDFVHQMSEWTVQGIECVLREGG